MSHQQRSPSTLILLTCMLLSACGSTPTPAPESLEPGMLNPAIEPNTMATPDDQNRFDSSLTLMAPDGYVEEFFSVLGDHRIDLTMRMLAAYSEGDYWPQASIIFYDLERAEFLACRLTQNEAGDLALSFARGDQESQIYEVTSTELYPIDHTLKLHITLQDDVLIFSAEGEEPWYLPLDLVINEYSVRVSSSRSRFDISYPTLFDGE